MHLSSAGKQAVILKAVNRGKTALRDIAAANNIGLSTLQRWLNAYQAGNVPCTLDPIKSHQFTLHEKQHHISAAEGLESVAKTAYCRQHGLYSHEIGSKTRNDRKVPEMSINLYFSRVISPT